MVYTELIGLIEVDDEIFIIWVFHSWLKIVFLTSESYQHNNSYVNHIKIIDIEHVQLKPLTFKNDLILMSILGVLFVAETVISTTDESISDTVDHF